MNGSNVLTFRDIEIHDQVSLLELRNTPSNLEFFLNPSPVSPGDHAKWFESRIKDYKGHQIVAVLSNQLIGIVFVVPIDAHSGSIAINIDSKYQSIGIGKDLLTQMLVRTELLKFTRIEAMIHVSNTKSVSLFEKCGFTFEEKVSDIFNRYVRFSSQNILK
jgi:RimJ/RimL family protein N-acetyltransferase